MREIDRMKLLSWLDGRARAYKSAMCRLNSAVVLLYQQDYARTLAEIQAVEQLLGTPLLEAVERAELVAGARESEGPRSIRVPRG